jgi:hypothetical protein
MFKNVANILCKLVLNKEFLGIVEKKASKNVHSFTAQSQNILHTVVLYGITAMQLWGGGAVIHLHGCRLLIY